MKKCTGRYRVAVDGFPIGDRQPLEILERREFNSFKAAKHYANHYNAPFAKIMIEAKLTAETLQASPWLKESPRNGWMDVTRSGQIPNYDELPYCRVIGE